MPLIEGPITVDRALAFLFGFLFMAAMLIFAVVVPNPTDTTFFIFRVVLATSAAGIGAVIPGLLDLSVPYLRASGALALAVLVYTVNPPALIRDSAEKKAVQSLNLSYALINRGNYSLARHHLNAVRTEGRGPIDVPFSWALSTNAWSATETRGIVLMKFSPG